LYPPLNTGKYFLQRLMARNRQFAGKREDLIKTCTKKKTTQLNYELGRFISNRKALSHVLLIFLKIFRL